MQSGFPRNSGWQELLAAPPPASHLVQLYDNDAFLASAVCHFAVEGLQRGEAVVLTGTPAHLADVRQGLLGRGLDADAALRSGQLATADARESIASLLSDGRLNPARFESVAGAALEKAAADRRFAGVRWWGEITNELYLQGDVQGALATEHLGAALGAQHGVTIFCSFLCDRFDARGYAGILKDVCRCHTHVIPAEDYVRHRLAVNRAIAEVVGEIKGSLLQSLSSWKGLACDLPSSQAILFWLHECMPEHFDAVLSRARAYQAQPAESPAL